MGGDGEAGVGRGRLPLCHVGGGSLRRPGCEWVSTAFGVDTYQRNRSYNLHTGSCRGRHRPGPGGYLQREVKGPLSSGNSPKPKAKREKEESREERHREASVAAERTHLSWQTQLTATTNSCPSLPLILASPPSPAPGPGRVSPASGTYLYLAGHLGTGGVHTSACAALSPVLVIPPSYRGSSPNLLKT